jgi:alanine-glyoxylate transaminase/serine-glyoxylate transaminase/serine-pyruvate transaminase
METCFVNLLEPGDKVIICQNGVFGGRMKENAERCGAVPILVQDSWGAPVDPNKLEEALKSHSDTKVVAFVHAETSTGAQTDVKTLVELAHRYDCLTIVDTVTSLGGSPVKVDEWGIDAVYSGSQKCLSCTPGLSPISFNERAVERIRTRRTKVQSWFLDLNLVRGYWGGDGKRAYHHTAPINALYGLHEALVILQEEGLEKSWARHQRNHQALSAGIEAMGLQFAVKKEDRLPQLNAIIIPNGIDDAVVRTQLLQKYGLEIGAGLGEMAGKLWRVGLMGYGSNLRNVLIFLGALETVLCHLGADIEPGAAAKAAQAA